MSRTSSGLNENGVPATTFLEDIIADHTSEAALMEIFWGFFNVVTRNCDKLPPLLQRKQWLVAFCTYCGCGYIVDAIV